MPNNTINTDGQEQGSSVASLLPAGYGGRYAAFEHRYNTPCVSNSTPNTVRGAAAYPVV